MAQQPQAEDLAGIFEHSAETITAIMDVWEKSRKPEDQEFVRAVCHEYAAQHPGRLPDFEDPFKGLSFVTALPSNIPGEEIRAHILKTWTQILLRHSGEHPHLLALPPSDAICYIEIMWERSFMLPANSVNFAILVLLKKIKKTRDDKLEQARAQGIHG